MSGKRFFSRGRWVASIEWGPPIIWRPRIAIAGHPELKTGHVVTVGMGWWIVSAGYRCRQ